MTFSAVISPSPRHPSLAVSMPHPLLSQHCLLGQPGTPNAGRRLQLLFPPAWISSRALGAKGVAPQEDREAELMCHGTHSPCCAP